MLDFVLVIRFQGDQSTGEIQVIGGDNFEKLKGKVRGQCKG